MANSSISEAQTKTLRHAIVVVGGGSAGITVAAQLLERDRNLDIAIVEPSDKHYYQPAWTLVGAGAYRLEDTIRDEKGCIPPGATWIKAAAQTFEPEENRVITEDGRRIEYDYLIVCPGIQIDWDQIEGLRDAIGKDGVTSNYSKDYAPYTWEAIQNFKGGNAIFTFPATPIKCPGAPQKIMYLADDTFRNNGVRDRTNVIYCPPGGKIFGVPGYCEALEKIADRRNIDVKYHHNLKAIRPQTKEAIFEKATEAGVEEVVIPYDLLHVSPPMSAPDFIKNSPLAVREGPSKGWVDVDQYTTQHNVYPNVFSLGDASSLPNSKTAAAIRRQAPALVENLLSLMVSRQLGGKYDGYACCPLVTGYGRTIMAEFDYDKVPKSSFPFDPTQERYSMWLVKRYVLPWLYWNRMLKGKPFEMDMFAGDR